AGGEGAGGRGGHRVPGQPAGGVRHRHDAGDRRRHGRPAAATAVMTGGSSPPRPEPLPRRRLGSSAVLVTELSFGGAAIGDLFTEGTDDDARAAIDGAWAGGVRAFGTPPPPRARPAGARRPPPREEYVICTKVGRLLDPAGRSTPGGAAGRGDRDTEGFAVPADHVRRFDFSADGVRRGIEASLERLGLDRVDI